MQKSLKRNKNYSKISKNPPSNRKNHQICTKIKDKHVSGMKILSSSGSKNQNPNPSRKTAIWNAKDTCSLVGREFADAPNDESRDSFEFHKMRAIKKAKHQTRNKQDNWSNNNCSLHSRWLAACQRNTFWNECEFKMEKTRGQECCIHKSSKTNNPHCFNK